MTLRRTLIAALSLGAVSSGAVSLGARAADAQAPERPRLEADADTADWRAYYAYGVAHVQRQPDLAERAFVWAGRLNPLAAEPLFGQYVAGWAREPKLYQLLFSGDRAAATSPVTQRLNSLWGRAMTRDPMVNQQLEKIVEDALMTDAEGNTLEYSTDALTQGMLAYDVGDYARAVKVLGEAIPKAKLRARYTRALAYYAMNDYASAAADLSAALDALDAAEAKNLTSSDVTNRKAVYALALGNVYRKAGKVDEAREAYGRALAADVSLAAAHVALADLALVGGDAATAKQEYATAVELSPNDGGIRARYGDALRTAGNFAGAATQYQYAIQLEPDFFVTYLNLGIVLDKQQKRDEAAAAYAQFLARAPRAFAPQVAAVRKRLGGTK